MSDGYEARRDPGDNSRILVRRPGRHPGTVLTLSAWPSADDIRSQLEDTRVKVHALEAALELVEGEEASESRRVARLASVAYEDAKNAGATPEDAMARSLAAVDADRQRRGEAVR